MQGVAAGKGTLASEQFDSGQAVSEIFKANTDQQLIGRNCDQFDH